MNISQLMRGLLGDTTSGDTRAMELKAGQVVRGVVMKVLDNNEAIVQINGVQVRARLEMAIQTGQSALLQVQPQSSGALVVLKQVDPSAAGLLDDTFRDFAKLLGLPDQKWALDIVKDLRREGFSFTRETAQAFHQAAAGMPPGANAEQWMQAAAAAFKRGLPMTAGTVSALHQTMFGPETHQLLELLQKQLGTAAAGGSAATAGGPTSGGPNALSQTAARVMTMLIEGGALLRGSLMAENANGGQAEPGIGSRAGIAANAQAVQEGPLGQSALQQAGAANAGNGESAVAQTVRFTANTNNWLGQMMKWLGVDHELLLAKAVTVQEGGGPQASQSQQSEVPAGRPGTAVQAQGQGHTFVQSSAAAAPSSTGQAAPDRAAGVLASAGIQAQEEQAQPAQSAIAPDRTAVTDSRQAAPFVLERTAHDGSQTQNQTQNQTQQSAQNIQQQLAQDTLKSALLALTASSDASAAVKETAQQLLNQITGQQLLLTPERNNSLFTHVTMFIPLNDKDGSQTASVHIQTRRGRKGELDADNCRLLFNLTMSTLGDMLVDVSVTDKIVSLNLWNDHPAMSELLEISRSDVADRLLQIGYQLSSLRTASLPKADEGGGETLASSKPQPKPPDLAQFASTRYKGVDFRI